MKKINSINYGGKILLAGGILVILLPAALWLISCIWRNNVIMLVMKISFGMLILLLFFIHLSSEFNQDRKINKYYITHQNMKIMVSKGKYECSACGNRQIFRTDTFCRICGVHFEKCKDKTPQEILNIKK